MRFKVFFMSVFISILSRKEKEMKYVGKGAMDTPSVAWDVSSSF